VLPRLDRAAQLEADNHQLPRRVTALEAELRDTTDSLDAARAANRDLMNMINR
jgi:cell division protein FtsB